MATDEEGNQGHPLALAALAATIKTKGSSSRPSDPREVWKEKACTNVSAEAINQGSAYVLQDFSLR